MRWKVSKSAWDTKGEMEILFYNSSNLKVGYCTGVNINEQGFWSQLNGFAQPRLCMVTHCSCNISINKKSMFIFLLGCLRVLLAPYRPSPNLPSKCGDEPPSWTARTFWWRCSHNVVELRVSGFALGARKGATVYFQFRIVYDQVRNQQNFSHTVITRWYRFARVCSSRFCQITAWI